MVTGEDRKRKLISWYLPNIKTLLFSPYSVCIHYLSPIDSQTHSHTQPSPHIVILQSSLFHSKCLRVIIKFFFRRLQFACVYGFCGLKFHTYPWSTFLSHSLLYVCMLHFMEKPVVHFGKMALTLTLEMYSDSWMHIHDWCLRVIKSLFSLSMNYF